MGRKIVRCLLLLLAATFLAPASIHATPGDLYVAGDTMILRYTPTGTKSTFASGLFQPTALAFDRNGNLFVADSGSCATTGGSDCSRPTKIYRFTPTGTRRLFASTPTSSILGMAFDSAGNLYAAAGNILKFAPDGNQTTFAASEPGPVGTYSWGLAFDAFGNLYATAAALGPTDTIVRFTRSGVKSTFATVPSGALALAFDDAGNLFAVVDSGQTILKITPSGSGSPFALGSDFGPIAFNGSGNLFAGLISFNSSEPSVVRFTPAGVRTTFAVGPFFPQSFAFEPTVEKVRNVSARSFVGTGDHVLIGGFILGGNSLATNAVVVRAIGPSLSQYGVTDALTDPTLELHNANGTIIARNNNWQDTQAAQITATGLAPADPRESAIFATLPAGNFTAVVRGASGKTGTALVEVYSTQ